MAFSFPSSLSVLNIEDSDLYHRRMVNSRDNLSSNKNDKLANFSDLDIDYDELSQWNKPPELPERNKKPLINENVNFYNSNVLDCQEDKFKLNKSGYNSTNNLIIMIFFS